MIRSFVVAVVVFGAMATAVQGALVQGDLIAGYTFEAGTISGLTINEGVGTPDAADALTYTGGSATEVVVGSGKFGTGDGTEWYPACLPQRWGQRVVELVW